MARRHSLGPVVTEALRACGIETNEEIRKLGWKEAWDRLRIRFPRFNNLNCAYGLAAADLGVDWRQLPAELKAEIRRHKTHM